METVLKLVKQFNEISRPLFKTVFGKGPDTVDNGIPSDNRIFFVNVNFDKNFTTSLP